MLLQKADFDESIVSNAIMMADEQPELSSYMGWIIRCIERGYTRTETVSGDADRARIVRNIKNDLVEHEDDVAERVWLKTTQKKEFDAFRTSVEKSGITMAYFDAAFDAKEKMDLYIEWKKDGRVSL